MPLSPYTFLGLVHLFIIIDRRRIYEQEQTDGNDVGERIFYANE